MVIFLIDTDAIIFDAEQPLRALVLNIYLYQWGRFSLPELYGVGDKVLKKLAHLRSAAIDGGELIQDLYNGLVIFDQAMEGIGYGLQKGFQVDNIQNMRLGVESGIFKQIFDEYMHVAGAGRDEVQVDVGVLVELARIFLEQ